MTYGITATLVGLLAGVGARTLSGGKMWSNFIAVLFVTIIVVSACEYTLYRSNNSAVLRRHSFDQWIQAPLRIDFVSQEQYDQAVSNHQALLALPEKEQRRRHAERVAVLREVMSINDSFAVHMRTHARHLRLSMLCAALGIYFGYLISARTASEA